MKNKILLIILALLIISCNEGKKVQPSIYNGVIDLKNWDFEKDGIIQLNGNWEFCWNEFYNCKKLDSITKKNFIKVPGVWKDEKINNIILPGVGYATYSLKVITNKLTNRLALKIPYQGTAYSLYINDTLIGKQGIIGKSKDSCKPKYLPQVIDFNQDNDTLHIVFWVSNFHYWKGGLWYPITLGTSNQVHNYQDKNLAIDYFGSGSLLTFYIIFFFMYLYRNEEEKYLFISRWVLVTLLRLISTKELIILRLLPDISWEFHVKIELMSLYLMTVFGILYYRQLYKTSKHYTVVLRLSLVISPVLVLITLFTPAIIHSHTIAFGKIYNLSVMFYFLIIAINSIRKRYEGSIAFAIGMIFFSVGTVSSYLVTINIFFVPYYVDYINGVLCLFIAQGIWLTYDSSKAFKNSEKYSNELLKNKEELEIKVEERTKELFFQKRKTEELLEKSDHLLLNVLPEQIAGRLKAGETPIADHFEEASVAFIDISDFTKISSNSTPQKMVKMLNEIFTTFDKIAAKYGLEKIKTIGDCYMAAAGIPEPRQDYIEAISLMAIDVMDVMKDYKTEDGNEIKFRIGLDCGPIVAGVIGEKKFIYDLWGDMVNTASRMETNGVVGRIQCTERFKNKFYNFNNNISFKFEERGYVEIKGKGLMKTYFLEKENLS